MAGESHVKRLDFSLSPPPPPPPPPSSPSEPTAQPSSSKPPRQPRQSSSRPRRQSSSRLPQSTSPQTPQVQRVTDFAPSSPQTPPSAPQPPPPPQQQQLLLLLCTAEGRPAGYNTKWEELHPVSQTLLLQIEDRIREYRDESKRLDQCGRLYDSSVSNNNFELGDSCIRQVLGGTTAIMEREKAYIREFMAVVNEIMWNTESVIRSYVMLRPRFIHPGAGTTGASTHFNQLVAMVPTFSFYSGVPKQPSLFIQHTVARFQKYLEECCKQIVELEQLVQMDNNKRSSDYLESLPKIMSNVHHYFVHIASKVESLHQYIESMKTQHIKDQGHRGKRKNPFLEADRREAAKKEAAARRVHPTLHLLPPVQPTTPIAAAATSQLQQSPFPSVATYSTAAPTPARSSPGPVFSTRTTPAPSTSISDSSGSAPQSTSFGPDCTLGFGPPANPLVSWTSTPSFTFMPGSSGSTFFSMPLGGVVATAPGSSSGASPKGRKRGSCRN